MIALFSWHQVLQGTITSCLAKGFYGEGVLPGTVITRVLPGLRKVEVTPGGLPTRLEATNSGMQFDSGGSSYNTDLYDDVLRMPATFNEFHALRVGQQVTIKADGGNRTGDVPAPR